MKIILTVSQASVLRGVAEGRPLTAGVDRTLRSLLMRGLVHIEDREWRVTAEGRAWLAGDAKLDGAKEAP